jgi:hypothetical protein
MQNNWKYNDTDYLNSQKNVDYNDILEWCNQEQIWSWIMNKYIRLGEFFTNELRLDTNPNCYLTQKGRYIRLQDWGNWDYHGMNVFSATMYKYNCELQEACKRIFYFGCNSTKLPKRNEYKNTRFKFNLSFVPKLDIEGNPRFTKADKEFWSKLKLSKEDLIGEVFSTYSYSHNSKSNPSLIRTSFPQDLSYTYIFPSGHKKIYHPNRIGAGKWLADVNNRDIWFKGYPQRSDILIVSKSYIDGKLIWKATDHNVEALQNEGCIPSVSDITRWVNTYDHIFFLYDIDVAGIRQSKKLVDFCNSIYEGKFSSLYLPQYLYNEHQITDCKDIVTKIDYYTFASYLNFIINEKLIEYHL